MNLPNAVTAARIAEAFALLGRHDLVFGPAADGGFWLVGCRHRPPDFGEVRWSSPHALEDTLANLPRRASVGFGSRFGVSLRMGFLRSHLVRGVFEAVSVGFVMTVSVILGFPSATVFRSLAESSPESLAICAS